MKTAASESLGRPVLVQKYGGSSVATAEHIKNVARRVVARHREGKAVVVVVSAMGKTTDSLINLSREITFHPERREMDMLLHAGEIISTALVAMAVAAEGVPSVSFTGQQAGMLTDASHTQARILAVDGARVTEELRSGKVVVIAGFQGVTEQLEVTTLGRGGSDTSAVAIAVGIGAGECEILTDVDGDYTADPRVVEKPLKMPWCSYDEMLELAILGAKVLHSRSVEIARRFDVPILVATSFRDAPGTVICSPERARKEFGAMEEVSVRGIAHQKNVTKVSLVGVPDQPGTAAKIFAGIGKHEVNINLIVQAEHHGGKNDISFLVESSAFLRVSRFLDELVALVGGERAVVDENVATVSLVGEGVQREPGIAARMFTALAREGINIDLISTSNLMITCVIPKDRAEDAVRALHRELFEKGVVQEPRLD
ncbi:MAG: aspartate kinase [Planctomycetes bacterium]|nr:aspartate kinase [Planctomycetota bacterium]